MFNRERGQMGIHGEISRGPGAAQKTCQPGGMLVSRVHHSDIRLREPSLYAGERFFRSQWVWKRRYVCGDADEPEERDPRQADGLCPGQDTLPPTTSLLMVRRSLVVRIDEKIDVRQYHSAR